MPFPSGRPLLAAILLLSSAAAWPIAKEVTPEHEFAKTLKDYREIAPGGEDAFGERISPASGELSFLHTDIVLEGTGPTITLARTTRTQQHPDRFDWPVFGDWDLSVPRIETLMKRDTAGVGPSGDQWRVGLGATLARCTQFDAPRLALDDWWHGYDFVTDDGARQPLLKRAAGNTLPMPAMTDASGAPMVFPALTLSHWQIGCLPRTSNGEPGEGFLAVAPDGTKVWLDHLTTGQAHTVIEDDPTGLPIHRTFAQMAVTRIEDRFGNWVRYHHDGKRLTGITAKDGRAVTIAWNSQHPVIDSITVMPGTAGQRTWRYAYEFVVIGGTAVVSGARLRYVTLPDGSAWKFAGEVGALDGPTSARTRECTTRDDALPISRMALTATVTSPSGAVGTFERQPQWRARSYTPSTCAYHATLKKSFETHPPVYGAYALAKRTIGGPGLPTRTWTWTYSPARGSTRQDACAATGSCAAEAWVDARDPDGNRTRRTFSTRWGITEGQPLRTEAYQGESTLLRSETLTYAMQGPWPGRVGVSRMGSRTNVDRLESLAPVLTRTITQQGVTFTSAVEAFDAFGRALRTKRSSSLGYSRTDAVTFADHTKLWVLGQVASSTNLDTGLVESRMTIDLATALPASTYAFGKRQQTRTWNADGTLASVSDGRDAPGFNTTVVYSDWKRGIPQKTTYPDGTFKTARVDDFGQLTWVEDELGYRTCHHFDAMGRLTRVTYPSETPHVCDESRWNPMVRSFGPSPTPSFGIPAGHWKELVGTGNGYTATYYDAFLRPLVVERFDAADKAGTLSQTVTRYAASGGVAFQSYPFAGLSNFAAVNHGTRTTYDALGRPTRVEQDSELGVLATKHEYVAGFQTRTTSPKGQVTQTGYQVYDEPSNDLVRGILHPDGTATDIPRDVFGKPTSITRRTVDRAVSLTRTYAYNAAQELCRSFEPETGTTLTGYDAAGNLSWSAAGLPAGTACDDASLATLARRSTRSYDQRNRLTELEFADDIGEQAWTYTPDGLPATVWTYNAPGRTEGVYNAWSYNSRRLPGGVGETLHEPGWTWALGYGYDRNGFVTVQLNPDTSQNHYVVNGLGQVTGISGTSGSYVSGARYFPNGALKQFTYGNGLLHTLEQNPRGLPERSKDAHAGIAVHDESYDYDAHGNVVAITDGATGRNQRGNRTMAYDGLDRLTAVSSPMFTAARYEYDALDNLKRVTIGGTSGRDHWYCHDAANRLTNLKTGGCGGVSVVGLGYDSQGNLTNKNGVHYTFSQDNRLRAAVGKETYRYDAAGRRVTADSPTLGRNRSFYNRDGTLAFRHDGRRQMSFAHVYLAGSLVATREQSTATTLAAMKYHHTDALGTPVAVTDVGRNVVERSENEPYGKLLNRPANDGPGYTGHVEDAQTGLTYMQQRYYDPLCGCFLSVDPVTAYGSGDMRSFARYAYAFNNPYRFTDPDGRNPLATALTGCAVTGPACPAGFVAGAIIGTAIIVGTYYGGGLLRDWLIQSNESSAEPTSDNQTGSGGRIKTPNSGEPGSVYVNPNNGQERLYGEDGLPELDVDYNHDHGQGSPHEHQWTRGPDGEPVRGPAQPVTSSATQPTTESNEEHEGAQ